MPRIKDLTGHRCNRLTVVGNSGKRSTNRSVVWTCLCDCGNIVYVESGILSGGKQKSCGCAMKGIVKWVGHGHARQGGATKTYYAWAGMKQRCTNPSHPKYKNYGMRGITVCEDWLTSFDNFLKDMGEKPAGMTLERKDVNQGYSKDNCCWANSKTQANNKTTNRVLHYDGKSMTSAQWAEHLGISFSALRQRLYRKWPLERVLK